MLYEVITQRADQRGEGDRDRRARLRARGELRRHLARLLGLRERGGDGPRAAGPPRPGLRRHQVLVITSYSIHYTKLYDIMIGANDTPCSQGTTSYALDGGSLVNVTVDTFNPLTGEVKYTPSSIAAWSFDYDIICTTRITSYNVCYTKLLRMQV